MRDKKKNIWIEIESLNQTKTANKVNEITRSVDWQRGKGVRVILFENSYANTVVILYRASFNQFQKMYVCV